MWKKSKLSKMINSLQHNFSDSSLICGFTGRALRICTDAKFIYDGNLLPWSKASKARFLPWMKFLTLVHQKRCYIVQPFLKIKCFESFHIKEQFLSSDKFYTYFLSQSQFKHSSIHYKHTARNLRKQNAKLRRGRKMHHSIDKLF